MADRFRLVPVKPEVAAGDGQIRGHGQFFAVAGSKERAVVANSQAQAVLPAAAGSAGRPRTNFADQGKFASIRRVVPNWDNLIGTSPE